MRWFIVALIPICCLFSFRSKEEHTVVFHYSETEVGRRNTLPDRNQSIDTVITHYKLALKGSRLYTFVHDCRDTIYLGDYVAGTNASYFIMRQRTNLLRPAKDTFIRLDVYGLSASRLTFIPANLVLPSPFFIGWRYPGEDTIFKLRLVGRPARSYRNKFDYVYDHSVAMEALEIVDSEYKLPLYINRVFTDHPDGKRSQLIICDSITTGF